MRQSHLYNGDSYTGKATSLYSEDPRFLINKHLLHTPMLQIINSLTPDKCSCNPKLEIFKYIASLDILRITRPQQDNKD